MTGPQLLRRVGSRPVLQALALFAALIMLATGYGAAMEGTLTQVRNHLRQHRAGGDLVLLEIDARSLAQYGAWPWPRHLYTRAIDAASRSGAGMIAFDIDFSARSAPAEDAAFAQAIARAQVPVVLPTFVQAADQGSTHRLENLPIAALRDHAMLASVNIAPDSDGLVRNSPVAVHTAEMARPSISVILSGRSVHDIASFPLDGSIDLSSLPRISFADVIAGRVPADRLRGKNLLVGATAIELGDRYAVPGYGVLPGAVVQLLAAETLRQGSTPWPLPGIIAFVPLILVLQRRKKMQVVRWLGAGLAILALPLGMEALHWGTVAVVPALTALVLLGVTEALLLARDRFHQARLIDGETGLGNGHALARRIGDDAAGWLVVLRIANHDELTRLLGSARSASFWTALQRRLEAVTRHQLYRIGPDALAWIDPETAIGPLADHLDAAALLIGQPLMLDDQTVRVIAGFGLAAMSQAGDAASDALDRARAAAARACRQGRRCVIYVEEDYQEADSRLILAADIETAIGNGQMFVVFQPKLDLASGAITGCEALLRWHHPVLGAVSPELVVAVAEDHECIAKLTRFVLDSAVTAQLQWQRRGHAISVAVNISPVLARDGVFLDELADRLTALRIPEGAITCEITETSHLEITGQSAAALERLVAAGARVSIDDYGTGQSTLSYLKRLPASELKIDKSFILNMVHDDKDRVMVRSTIALAHDLGYAVVAEGVETQDILDDLVALGCDYAQGWLIGRPVAPAALADLLDAAQNDPAKVMRVRRTA